MNDYERLRVTRGEILNFFNHLYNRRTANTIYHDMFANESPVQRYLKLRNAWSTDPLRWSK